MKLIRGIEFCAGSREERLPDFAPDLPYIASRAEMDFYPERFVPWHWHSAVEVLYMESGSFIYGKREPGVQHPPGEGRVPPGVGRASGLGSGSYFGKLFREAMGCTPSEYRRRWQGPAKNGQDRR